MPDVDRLLQNHWMNRRVSHDDVGLPYGFATLAAGVDAQAFTFHDQGVILSAHEIAHDLHPDTEEFEHYRQAHTLENVSPEDDVLIVDDRSLGLQPEHATTWVEPDGNGIVHDGHLFGEILHIHEFHPYDQQITSVDDLAAEFNRITGHNVDLR